MTLAERDGKGRFMKKPPQEVYGTGLQEMIEALYDKLAQEARLEPTATAVAATLQKEETRMDLFEKKELIRRAEARLGVGIVGGNDPKNLLAHAAARREALNKELRDIAFLESFADLMEKFPEQFAE